MSTLIEVEGFTPLLVDTNLARRKVCAAIEHLGALLMEILAEKILPASPHSVGADEESTSEESAELMA
jgi:hypothetical protein